MAENQQKAKRVFEIKKIYLKDLSYESPRSPDVFTDSQTPEISVNVGVKHNPLAAGDNFYDVLLVVTVEAKKGGETIFLAEVQQAGVFEIVGSNQAETLMGLEIAAPGALLPFAREVVADLVGKGGFPQLLLNPINFEAMFAAKMKQRQEAAQNTARVSDGAGDDAPAAKSKASGGKTAAAGGDGSKASG